MWVFTATPACWQRVRAAAERLPPRQVNTTSPFGRASGSNRESGIARAPGMHSAAVSLGSRTSTSTISPRAIRALTSAGSSSIGFDCAGLVLFQNIVGLQ